MKIKKNKYSKFILFIALVSFVFGVKEIRAAVESVKETKTSQTITVVIQKRNSLFMVPAFNEMNLRKYGSIYVDSFESYKGKVYNGTVTNFKNETLGYFPAGDMRIEICRDIRDRKMNKQVGGCEEEPDGDILLEIPYFSTGKSAEIFSPEGKKILTIDLTSVATCNENGVCDSAKESNASCPSDCPPVAVAPVAASQPNVPAAVAGEKESGSNFWIVAIIAVVLLIVAAAVYLFWRLRKNKSGDEINDEDLHLGA